MSLSSFEEKFEERRNNYFLSSSEDEEEEEEEEGAKNDDFGISINRGKLRKNSRLGFSTKKKRSTQNFAFTQHLHNKKEQQSARSRVFVVCVCVCRFRGGKQHIHTHERKKWRQTGCLEEETPPRVVLSVTQPKEIITF